jgi:hypothetical protein
MTPLEPGDAPRPQFIGLGNAENNERWREIKAPAKAARGAMCERGGRKGNLDLQHRTAQRYGGKETIDNAALLCRPCPVQPPTFGDHRRRQCWKAKCEETRTLRLGRGRVKPAWCEP